MKERDVTGGKIKGNIIASGKGGENGRVLDEKEMVSKDR